MTTKKDLTLTEKYDGGSIRNDLFAELGDLETRARNVRECLSALTHPKRSGTTDLDILGTTALGEVMIAWPDLEGTSVEYVVVPVHDMRVFYDLPTWKQGGASYAVRIGIEALRGGIYIDFYALQPYEEGAAPKRAAGTGLPVIIRGYNAGHEVILHDRPHLAIYLDCDRQEQYYLNPSAHWSYEQVRDHVGRLMRTNQVIVVR